MNRQAGKINSGTLAGIVAGVAIIVAIVAIVRFDVTGKRGSGLSGEYVYDIEALGKTDANLILYEEVGLPFATGLETSRCIAVGAVEKIYVGGDHAILIFDDGRQVGKIGLEGSPTALSIFKDGTIYAALTDHIEVSDSTGGGLSKWKSAGEKAIITSIAVAGDDVFAADAGNRIVLRYDKNGAIINQIGRKDADRNIPGFVIPSPYFDIAMASDGLLRVANPGKHSIEAYTAGGELEFSWGKASPRIDGFCGCCNPINFAILDDDSFVTCEKGLVRVKLYDAEGSFVGVVAGPEILVPGRKVSPCESPEACRSGGFDIAVDKDGRVYVLDTIKNTVRIFAKKKDMP